MKFFFTSISLLYLSFQVLAQGEANIWYFGSYAGVDFNGGSPVALTNGALSTGEGCASICNRNGNLLFYTDGITVWNRNHAVMTNGVGLLGDPSTAQSAVIVPKPGAPTHYYIFTVAAQGNPGGFCYSEVDMTQNGGLGDVIVATKNTQLFTPSAEKCTAVKHANGIDVWVIGHGIYNNTYYAYLVTCNGVGNAVITSIGQNEGWPGWGCLQASPNGQKLASAVRASGFELLDFDNATGVVSNPINLGNVNDSYGVSFSPDNNVLYGSKINDGTVWQWNLQAGSPAAIVASIIQVGVAAGTASPYRGGTLQLGPDGKLYFPAYGTPYLCAINNPNVVGAGCGFTNNAVNLAGRNAVLGLPPFVQSFFDTTQAIQYVLPGCANHPVNFSVNGNTSYLDSVHWNFGDAASGALNFSGSVSPTHTYASGGTYSVQLIRYVACVADTTNTTVNIIAPVNTTQNITICPGASFTTASGNVVTLAGSYADTIQASGGCDSIINTQLSIASFSVDAGNDVSICRGDSTQLSASGGLIYSWSPAAGLSDPNIGNPSASPASSTTYTVTSQVPIGNLIVNGDFSAGNSGFTSSYTYTTTNTTEGQFYVGPNAAAWNGGMATCGDHTNGTGNMLCVNGATTANVSIYCETVNVIPNTLYAFSTWLNTLSLGNLAQLQFSINSSLLGSTFTAPANTCNWQQFYQTWNSGSNTTATICIVNQNTNAGANDFALDDILFAPLCAGSDTVRVTVNPVYSDTVTTSICQNQSYTLPDGSSTSTAGTYTHQLATINSCDSTITTQLSVNPVFAYSVTQTICPSDLYILPDGTPVSSTGVYPVTLQTVNGCDSVITTQLTVVPPVITISADTQICLSNSVQLNAGGGLYTYRWTPAAGLSSDTIPNPVATPTQTTTYVVTTQVASGDLIANGDFENGNAGFSSSYVYGTNITPAGTYYVANNPNTYHSGFAACGDHTTGAGNMMIVNGSSAPNVSVWCETINVVPNTDYAFGTWIAGLNNGSPAILQFQINGSLIGPPFTASTTSCLWQQFYAVWNSGANTTADICIVNQNTTVGGNDFALDDISFIGLCPVSDSVTITVHQPTTVNITAVICQGESYTFPNGTNSSTSVIDTSLLFDQFGCDSTIITDLTVNPTYAANVYDTICSNQNYTLPSGTSVNQTGIYADTLNTMMGCDSIIVTYLTVHSTSSTSVLDTICIGSTYTLPDGNTVASTGTYPVTLQNQFGCDSVVSTQLTVIDAALTLSTVDVLCNGGSTGGITATATDGLSPYHFDLLNGGAIISSNATGLFNSLFAGVYTVNITDNFGCTETATATISEPTLLAINHTIENVHCFGEDNGAISITANGGAPAYTFSMGNQSNATGSFVSLTAGNYIYTVTDAHGCSDTITVTVTEPAAITLAALPDSAVIKLGETIQLNVTSNYDPSTTYQWLPQEGLSCYTCANPVADTYDNMLYTIQATVNISGNNCAAQIQLPVTVLPNYDIFIPNVFTPNSDGNNDLFSIYGNIPALKFLDIQIFNRIGEKVFESNDLHFTWDGTYKGQLLPPGVFVYTMKAVFVDNHTEKLFKGSITLLK